ncbi:acyltransferase domain-containing protein [Paraburkholderia humisilvae]|uniref:Polyketide biosynthesis malonyl CoA-acyl carrier protein transacylase BaeC n=1 Tax=Paraburkholderia humisilvae TaxID=627669 RepID=A0A6J5F3Y0_9BURK|nr:acyltransferase domain-containing protein [Paraburkholderia humisilvae]CAB3773560.1 Polyketide biosynthesis malonyl CoA-acyl carrier protein transacylase BaeC [Paraburkholderia humisilvae]
MSESTIAILCSGQGRQHREMFDAVSDVPEAQAIFREASAYLEGVDPREFVRSAPEGALYSNRIGQLLCCTQALAAWAALGTARPKRAVIAGYSVGELAAWGCAGILAPGVVLALAEQRARLMDIATPPEAGLLGVVGLRASDISGLLEMNSLWIAIVNDVDSYVVGGLNSDLLCFEKQALKTGARHIRRLNVAVPSHTPLLRDACQAFAEQVKRHALYRPLSGLRVLSGIDGDWVVDTAEGVDKLAAQIAQTVRWGDCLRSCIESGAIAALELGPGDALCRMLTSVDVSVPVRAYENFRRADGVKKWLDTLN